MASRKIHVTPDDIRGANPSAENCPTARAVRRTLKETRYVAVWTGRVQVGRKVYGLPMECDGAETLFSREKRMLPYSFHLSNKPVIEPPNAKQP